MPQAEKTPSQPEKPEKPEKPPGQPPVEFTLDGIPHSSIDRRMPAGDILRTFGGLDPADYDLIRVVGNGQEKPYADTEEVELVPHGRYVSFFTGAMPVE